MTYYYQSPKFHVGEFVIARSDDGIPYLRIVVEDYHQSATSHGYRLSEPVPPGDIHVSFHEDELEHIDNAK